MPARRRGRIREPPAEPEPEPVIVFEGRGYWRGRITELEFGVDPEGMITRVAKNVRGSPRRNLGDRVVLPSGIDLHAHFRDPGPPESGENLDFGTVSAALGGISAAVDMPNTIPPTTSVERVVDKISRIRTRAHVDILPYAAVTAGASLRRLGLVAAGFKLFLAPTTGEIKVPEPAEVPRLLAEIESTGLPVHVHAEDPAKFNPRETPTETDAWDRSRPEAAELSAIEQLREHPPGLRLHIAHVTTVASAQRAREIGAGTEATPHHLLLSSSLFGTAFQKVNPPLRTESTRAALFQRFKEGGIPMLASDHAPHPISRKEAPFAEAPSGVPGIETMVPLMLELVRRTELPLPVLVRAVARNPAYHLGLPRGRLEKGCEANFFTVDFRTSRILQARSLTTRCGWTPFEGRAAIFPVDHYLRGSRIVEDGEFVGGPRGKAIRATPLVPATPKGPTLPAPT